MNVAAIARIKALMASGIVLNTVQRLLALDMDVKGLRTNATLLHEEWVEFDNAVLMAAQDRLVGVADLLARGLEHTVANGMGKTMLQRQTVSNMQPAQVVMEIRNLPTNDRVDYGLAYLPLPVTHHGWELGPRTLAASREKGESLDTTQARLSGIEVADKTEDMLFNGLGSYAFASGTLYGYTDFPTRHTKTLSDWSSATATTIVNETIAMKQLLLDDKRYGPWILYICPQWETVMDKDYDTSGQSTQTIRERLLKIGGLEDIKVADKLADKNVVMAQMTMECVRMVTGLPLTNVEWESQGDMVLNFMAIQIQVPEIVTDYDGRNGIVHGTAP